MLLLFSCLFTQLIRKTLRNDTSELDLQQTWNSVATEGSPEKSVLLCFRAAGCYLD